MDNINTQKRFIFKQPFTCKMGTIPEGSQLDFAHNTYFFNGGMCDSYSTGMFTHILNTPELKKKYLKEVYIPINKL